MATTNHSSWPSFWGSPFSWVMWLRRPLPHQMKEVIKILNFTVMTKSKSKCYMEKNLIFIYFFLLLWLTILITAKRNYPGFDAPSKSNHQHFLISLACDGETGRILRELFLFILVSTVAWILRYVMERAHDKYPAVLCAWLCRSFLRRRINKKRKKKGNVATDTLFSVLLQIGLNVKMWLGYENKGERATREKTLWLQFQREDIVTDRLSGGSTSSEGNRPQSCS